MREPSPTHTAHNSAQNPWAELTRHLQSQDLDDFPIILKALQELPPQSDSNQHDVKAIDACYNALSNYLNAQFEMLDTIDQDTRLPTLTRLIELFKQLSLPNTTHPTQLLSSAQQQAFFKHLLTLTEGCKASLTTHTETEHHTQNTHYHPYMQAVCTQWLLDAEFRTTLYTEILIDIDRSHIHTEYQITPKDFQSTVIQDLHSKWRITIEALLKLYIPSNMHDQISNISDEALAFWIISFHQSELSPVTVQSSMMPATYAHYSPQETHALPGNRSDLSIYVLLHKIGPNGHSETVIRLQQINGFLKRENTPSLDSPVMDQSQSFFPHLNTMPTQTECCGLETLRYTQVDFTSEAIKAERYSTNPSIGGSLDAANLNAIIFSMFADETPLPMTYHLAHFSSNFMTQLTIFQSENPKAYATLLSKLSLKAPEPVLESVQKQLQIEHEARIHAYWCNATDHTRHCAFKSKIPWGQDDDQLPKTDHTHFINLIKQHTTSERLQVIYLSAALKLAQWVEAHHPTHIDQVIAALPSKTQDDLAAQIAATQTRLSSLKVCALGPAGTRSLFNPERQNNLSSITSNVIKTYLEPARQYFDRLQAQNTPQTPRLRPDITKHKTPWIHTYWTSIFKLLMGVIIGYSVYYFTATSLISNTLTATFPGLFSIVTPPIALGIITAIITLCLISLLDAVRIKTPKNPSIHGDTQPPRAVLPPSLKPYSVPTEHTPSVNETQLPRP
jgi:hypothetical protein